MIDMGSLLPGNKLTESSNNCCDIIDGCKQTSVHAATLLNNSLISSLVHKSIGVFPSRSFTLISAPALSTSSTFGASFSLHAIKSSRSTGSNPAASIFYNREYLYMCIMRRDFLDIVCAVRSTTQAYERQRTFQHLLQSVIRSLKQPRNIDELLHTSQYYGEECHTMPRIHGGGSQKAQTNTPPSQRHPTAPLPPAFPYN